MTREALAWWLTWGTGFASGLVVMGLACGRLRRAQRLLDRLLGEAPPPRPPRPYRIVPVGQSSPRRRPPAPRSQRRPPPPPPPGRHHHVHLVHDDEGPRA